MNKRRLWLSGMGLSLLLVTCGALNVTGSADDDAGFYDARHPVMRVGGPVEKTLRIVPFVHEAIWPTPLIPVYT